MKKRLTALEEFFYDGKTNKLGEEFEAVDPDAIILVAIGKAKEAVSTKLEKAKPAPQKLETEDLKAEEPSSDPEENSPTRKRRYLRRDMRATE